MNWLNELEISKCAAVEAGKAIMEIYLASEDMQVEYKDGNMPLTAADKASNRVIVEALKKHFPDYAILSEEEKDDLKRLDHDYCFIVDPLDGTKEFIKRNGQFTVNIALVYQNRSVMGVIYVPATGELYYACEGQGAFRMNLHAQDDDIRSRISSGEGAVRLHVSENSEIGKLRMVMSGSHGCAEQDALIEKYQLTNFVKIGSSLKGCMVAGGDADIYYRYNPTMEWDTAAMQCIVEEAGGIFRQMDGSEMMYNRKNSLNEKGFYIVNRKENILI